MKSNHKCIILLVHILRHTESMESDYNLMWILSRRKSQWFNSIAPGGLPLDPVEYVDKTSPHCLYCLDRVPGGSLIVQIEIQVSWIE